PVEFPSGWQSLTNTQHNGGALTLAMAFRVATGTEGSSILATTSKANRSVHHSYRIADYGAGPQGSVAQNKDGQPDPPLLPAAWGVLDTLWIVAGVNLGPLTSASPNYQSVISNDTGGTGIDHAWLVSARREAAVASEDPGLFGGDNMDWLAATV